MIDSTILILLSNPLSVLGLSRGKLKVWEKLKKKQKKRKQWPVACVLQNHLPLTNFYFTMFLIPPKYCYILVKNEMDIFHFLVLMELLNVTINCPTLE